MATRHFNPSLSLLAVAALTLLQTACGGGGGAYIAAGAPDGLAAEPSFHRLPMSVAAPSDIDADGTGASAGAEPRIESIPPDLVALDTRGLTDEGVQAFLASGGRVHALAASAAAKPAAAVVYTPAQIRAAYRLPVLPASTTGLTTTVAAGLGAGQTIYIVDAYAHPNALADLAAFSKKFGLPTCTAFSVATTAKALPAVGSGCSVTVLYSAANATLTGKAPAYNAGWAQETALDMQWAHAIAPLARIVLIESADASLAGLSNAVAVANRFGAGAVSMSFGAGEGSWVTGSDGSFRGAGMSYLAATGDSGAAVAWPAASPFVMAVGGTTLQATGSTRSEVVWPGTGGGISAYVPLPSWQAALSLVGQSPVKHRAVADLAFNADPSTGQYVAFTAQGAKAPAWYVFGGTSLSTPQWAGLVAVADAQRALKSLPALGDFHATLYSRFAPGSSGYVLGFNDIGSGSNGTCAGCRAAAGYDTPTGLGSPKADGLLSQLVTK